MPWPEETTAIGGAVVGSMLAAANGIDERWIVGLKARPVALTVL
jgi:hypothetical protein